MSDFRFSLDELMKGDSAVFSREINKQLNDPNTPLRTSASMLGGREDFLSTLSVGQILMGMPAANTQQDVFSMLDTAMTSITGALSTAAHVVKKPLSAIATAFDYLLPGDIATDALNFFTDPATKSALGSGSGSSGTTDGSIPGTSSTVGQPSNQDFLSQCQRQFGKPYTQANPQRFGPDQFDCSGFVYTALRTIGLKSPSIPTVSGTQYAWCRDDPQRKGGGAITVDQAIRTPGALLFKGNQASQHVAVSAGNGQAYQAVGHAYLSGSFPARNFGSPFTLAGLIPGLFYQGIDGAAPTTSQSGPPIGTGRPGTTGPIGPTPAGSS